VTTVRGTHVIFPFVTQQQRKQQHEDGEKGKECGNKEKSSGRQAKWHWKREALKHINISIQF
jgi:hypothetical protein